VEVEVDEVVTASANVVIVGGATPGGAKPPVAGGGAVATQGPITSHACIHAPPYFVEKGSNPTCLQYLTTASVLHFNTCPFLDAKLPAMYSTPNIHSSMGQLVEEALPGDTTAGIVDLSSHGPTSVHASL